VPWITTNIKTKAVIRIPICLIKSRIPCVSEHRLRYCPVRPRDTRKNPDERIPWCSKRRYFPLVEKQTVCFQSNNVIIWTFWSVISISFNYIMFLKENFEILARRQFFCNLLEVSCFNAVQTFKELLMWRHNVAPNIACKWRGIYK
jgi:hypothetical protein